MPALDIRIGTQSHPSIHPSIFCVLFSLRSASSGPAEIYSSCQREHWVDNLDKMPVSCIRIHTCIQFEVSNSPHTCFCNVLGKPLENPHRWGNHEDSTQKAPELNGCPSCCKATALTTAHQCLMPTKYTCILKLAVSANGLLSLNKAKEVKTLSWDASLSGRCHRFICLFLTLYLYADTRVGSVRPCYRREPLQWPLHRQSSQERSLWWA